ncbi:inhibitor of growth proteins N-terminal histone-binding-domain-containing protein [Limtongia smithiae]|uniref:inhibitor of growth proteins N-terminal histone-binding-domain-containing protein n=1 Tax=Limtongia smithiae TaxID=1125753 RepID=UPI0034CF10C2
MSVDAAYVLEQFQQDLVTVPEEVAHYLEEIKGKDIKLFALRRRILHCDNQIQKHIRAHGALAEIPKEASYNGKIVSDLEQALKLQDEKCELAGKLHDLVTRHLKRLDVEIRKLQNDGVLAPTTEPVVLPAIQALRVAASASNGSNSAAAAAANVAAAAAAAAAAAQHHHNHQMPIDAAALATQISRGQIANANAAAAVFAAANAAVSTNTPGGMAQRPPAKRQKTSAGFNGMDNAAAVLALTGRTAANGSAAGIVATAASALAFNMMTADGARSIPANIVNQMRASGLVPRGVVPVGNGHGQQLANSTTVKKSQKMQQQQHSSRSGTAAATPASGEDDEDEENNDSALYCFCQQVSYGDMVACDNPDCQYEWFHYGCVGLKAPPSGVWYCSTVCQEKAQSSRRGRK